MTTGLDYQQVASVKRTGRDSNPLLKVLPAVCFSVCQKIYSLFATKLAEKFKLLKFKIQLV